MKIERVRAFKKIKGVFGEGLCLAEEHGLMIAYHDDFRTVAAYSFETGERVWMHKFGRYCNIFSIERIGRWVFVTVDDCGSECVRCLTLDLDTLVSVLWHDEGIAPFESAGRSFVIGPKVLFLMSKPWDDSVRPRCVLFDTNAGSLGECPELAERWRGVLAVTPQCAVRSNAVAEGGAGLGLYRVDAEGLPTDKLIGVVQDSQLKFRGCLDDRICLFRRTEDLRDIGIAIFSLDGNRMEELPFPPMTSGVPDDGKAISAEVVLVNVSGKDMLLVLRWERQGQIDFLQYLLFDVDLKEMVWSRSFMGFGVTGAILTARAIIHPNDKDRMDVTDLATGAASEHVIDHYLVNRLDGVALPRGINRKFDCRGIGDHLFWMGNPSRALNYGRAVL